jgi:hypothetical protein
MKTLKEQIAVMQEYDENHKPIQYKYRYSPEAEWVDTSDPHWDWVNYDYRVKPEVLQYPVCYRWITSYPSYCVPNFYKVQLTENYFLWFTHDFRFNYSALNCVKYSTDTKVWELLPTIPPQIQLFLDKVYGVLELLARPEPAKFKWYRHCRLHNYIQRIDDKYNIVSFYATILPERSPQNCYDIINNSEYYEIEEEVAVKYITENSELWKLNIDPLGEY